MFLDSAVDCALTLHTSGTSLNHDLTHQCYTTVLNDWNTVEGDLFYPSFIHFFMILPGTQTQIMSGTHPYLIMSGIQPYQVRFSMPYENTIQLGCVY